MKKKLLSIALATIVAVMAISGASLAWLQDTTDPVTNTFTKGLVDIDLFEHVYQPESNTLGDGKVMENANYKMIPGKELPKDPTVVVKANSEACYVFIKVEEINDVETFLSYSIDDSVWTKLTGYEGVYYVEVNTLTTQDTEYNVLTNKKVTVNEEVEMSDMDTLDGTNNPQLKFTAYAIQKLGFDKAADAWAEFVANP